MPEPSPAPAERPLSQWATALLLLIVFINMIGFGVVVPLLPFYGSAFEVEAWQITLLFATFAGGQFLGELVWGRLSDRIGRRPVLLITLLASALGYVALAFAPNIWAALAARAVGGFFSGNISTVQGYIVDVTPQQRLSSRLGLIGSAIGIGFVVGPTLGGLLAHPEAGLPGFRPPLLVAAGLGLVAALGVIFFLRESRSRRARAAEGPSLLKGARQALSDDVQRRLLASTFFAFMGFSAAWSVLGLWGDARFGWGPRTIGLLMAGTGVAAALTQGMFAGFVARRVGEARTAGVGLGLSAGFLISMAILPWEGAAMVCMLGAVAGNALSQPPITALISRAADEDSQGSILGANAAASALARVAGPVMSGFLFTGVGAYAPYLFAAAATTPAVFYVWLAAKHLRMRTWEKTLGR